jgi:hypothetical protein
LTSVKKVPGRREDSGKNGKSIRVAKSTDTCVSEFLEIARAEERARNKMTVRELVVIAALGGGGDLNEAIYQSSLYRRGACSLGDSGISDAARSGKRPCHRRR